MDPIWIARIIATFCFCLVTAAENQEERVYCYDCHYDPDAEKLSYDSPSARKYPGYPKCAFYDSVNEGSVDKWPCKSGRCFIRRDPNGLVYRGCADPWNLPWNVDVSKSCELQGQKPSLWWFCEGNRCNGDSFENGDICSENDSPQAYDAVSYESSNSNNYDNKERKKSKNMYVETVHGPMPGDSKNNQMHYNKGPKVSTSKKQPSYGQKQPQHQYKQQPEKTRPKKPQVYQKPPPQKQPEMTSPKKPDVKSSKPDFSAEYGKSGGLREVDVYGVYSPDVAPPAEKKRTFGNEDPPVFPAYDPWAIPYNPDYQKYGYPSDDNQPQHQQKGKQDYGKGKSHMVYEQPKKSYAPPQKSYEPPEKSYEPPPQKSYEPSQKSYEPPTKSYGPPQKSYEPPQKSYEPSPQKSYEPTQKSYKPPQKSHQQSKKTHNQSQKSLGTSKKTYEPAPKSYQPSSKSHQPPQKSYQPSSKSHQPPHKSYQPSSKSYQPPPKSYQPSQKSHKTSKKSYQAPPSKSYERPQNNNYKAQPQKSHYQSGQSKKSHDPMHKSIELQTHYKSQKAETPQKGNFYQIQNHPQSHSNQYPPKPLETAVDPIHGLYNQQKEQLQEQAEQLPPQESYGEPERAGVYDNRDEYEQLVSDGYNSFRDQPPPQQNGNDPYASPYGAYDPNELPYFQQQPPYEIEEKAGRDEGAQGGIFYERDQQQNFDRPEDYGFEKKNSVPSSSYNPCDGYCSNNPSGLFPNPEDDYWFIQCGNGMDEGRSCSCCKPYNLRCPDGLTFDAVTRVCNDASTRGERPYMMESEQPVQEIYKPEDYRRK